MKISQLSEKLGYYTVGSRKFLSKIEACVEATRVNIFPQWHFNDEVWNRIDWTVEPELTIQQLYRLRARQIREQYDYVIVSYSGGVDSQTLVNAFLDTNSHIDEIVTLWNRKNTKKIITNPSVTDSRNIEAEFDLTTRPGLEMIKNRSPQTKITYYDVSDRTLDLFNKYDGEEWLETSREHLNPHFVTRFSNTQEHDQLIRLDGGKRTAVVLGVDKPRVSIKDNRYCLTFIDTLVNNCQGGFDSDIYDNVEQVFFYWAPDLPEIVVKQAHMIRNWFEKHPELKPIILWPNHDFIKRQTYEVLIKTIIYPEWDLSIFQCQKPDSPVWCQWDDWFFTGYSQSKMYQSWYKGIEYIEKNVDKKYLNYTFDNRFNGFVGMINGHFYLEKSI